MIPGRRGGRPGDKSASPTKRGEPFWKDGFFSDKERSNKRIKKITECEEGVGTVFVYLLVLGWGVDTHGGIGK